MRRFAPWVLTLFIAFVFIQSLFYMFSNSPETMLIFGTLNEWALSLGLPGVFAEDGIFSGYVFGSAELIASILLLLGLLLSRPLLGLIGSVMALGIMTGAIFFHLFTPLGVEVQGDGGTLFFMACGVWVSALILTIMRRGVILK